MQEITRVRTDAMRYILRKLFGKTEPQKTQLTVSSSLDKVKKQLKEEIFVGDDSIAYREYSTATPHARKCLMVFSQGMVDKDLLSDYIIRPMTESSVPVGLSGNRVLDFLEDSVITVNGVERKNSLPEIIDDILAGDATVFVDGCDQAFTFSSKFFPQRLPQEPVSESVVRGPREGFAESLQVNMTLVRKRIRSPMLKFKYKQLGMYTHTKIAVAYIEGIASPAIVKEVEERLDKIEIDGILESGYIEEFIRDSPLSIFKTIGHTERPDVVAGKLLEGRVAIFVDGTPFVLTMPYLFIETFQANEDYYKHFIISSLDRLVRYTCFFLTTSLPAIYLSLITYHHELIPTTLILSISAARQGVPFPAVVEVFAMGLMFEILREGGVRLPSPIGQALSIVGAIVIGDAAVSAQLISAPLIVLVAATAIAGFAVPKIYGASIWLRAIFTLLAAIFGLYGYFFGVIGLGIHLMSLRSFGVPYMLNYTSYEMQDVKDTALRAPWWFMRKRPRLISRENKVRFRGERK